MLFEPKQNIARFSNMNLRSSVSSSMPNRKYSINSCRSAHFATHVRTRNTIGPRLVGSPAKPSAFQGPIHQKLPERLALHLHRILFYPILCKSRTVSIWHDTIGWMSLLFFCLWEQIHSRFLVWAVCGNISTAFLALSVDENISIHDKKTCIIA